MSQKNAKVNLPLANLSSEEFRSLMTRRIFGASDAEAEIEGDHLLNQHHPNEIVEKAVKPAAVLIPVIERENGLQMVFTKRTEQLRSHSGQVSFPGGKIDAGDKNGVDAALRETHEEIGIAPDAIEVMAQFPHYHSGSGYLITPVVGMLKRDAIFEANHDEVEFIFEVPLEYLMNPDNHEIHAREFNNVEWQYYQMVWGEHRIWGVTAGMVRMFYNRVFK